MCILLFQINLQMALHSLTSFEENQMQLEGLAVNWAHNSMRCEHMADCACVTHDMHYGMHGYKTKTQHKHRHQITCEHARMNACLPSCSCRWSVLGCHTWHTKEWMTIYNVCGSVALCRFPSNKMECVHLFLYTSHSWLVFCELLDTRAFVDGWLRFGVGAVAIVNVFEGEGRGGAQAWRGG